MVDGSAWRRLFRGGISVIGLLAPALALAQGDTTVQPDSGAVAPAGQSGQIESADIIVTARKRNESILRTPVVVQAVTAKQIEDLKLTDMYQLSTVTPGLKITIGFASVGAVANMRGLGNGLAANFIDQSVLLNVDGAALSHGAFYRVGLFDVAQIEVLKGPQSLFFGKSSSAGIVGIHSADPGDVWESKLTGGYEFNADEWFTDGYVSGPLSDHFGIRVAGYFNSMKGWLRNSNPLNSNHRLPNEQNLGGRVTLKYSDSVVHGTLKLSKTHNENNAFDGDINQRNCTGDVAQVPQYQPYDDCKINFRVSGNQDSLPWRPDLDFSLGSPNFFKGVPSRFFRDGRGWQQTDTTAAIGNLDVDVAEGLKLTSVSAFSEVKAIEAGRSYYFNFVPLSLDLGARYRQRSVSQELRLTSDWKDSWINFMVGALYTEDRSHTRLYLGIPEFTFFTDDDMRLKSTTKSAFAQLLLTPVPKWELSVGARYTDVTKRITQLFNRDNIPDAFEPLLDGDQTGSLSRNHLRFNEDNLSPEVTLTYRPTDALTTFISYKHGYKGPGFNINTTASTYSDALVGPFAGEKVRGFEGGIKAALLDRTLALTLALYRYNYKGLQVAFPNLNTNTVDIRNGADARIQGVELGANYRPRAIHGLSLNAFVNYNDAKFTSFDRAPCYGGQVPATGCTFDPQFGSSQDLGGERPSGAPKWVGSFGFDYDTPISDSLKLGISTNSNFSSKYYYVPEHNPNGIQNGYITFDAAVRLGSADDVWEVAFLGRNLTNKAIATDGQDAGTVIPGVASDAVAFVARSRQLVLQLTVRQRQNR